MTHLDASELISGGRVPPAKDGIASEARALLRLAALREDISAERALAFAAAVLAESDVGRWALAVLRGEGHAVRALVELAIGIVDDRRPTEAARSAAGKLERWPNQPKWQDCMNARGSSAPCYHPLVSTSRPARSLATSQDLIARSGPPAEIIGGELVEKATPSPEHGSAQFALSGQLFSPFGSSRGSGGPGGWWLMTEVEVEYETHEIYRHDHLGFRRDRHPVRPSGRPVTERPDWVCEILSASNASNDTVRKLRTLHQAGVPHYWLLDPERLTLTVLRWTSEGYLEALIATADETVRAEPFEAIELPLADIFGTG